MWVGLFLLGAGAVLGAAAMLLFGWSYLKNQVVEHYEGEVWAAYVNGKQEGRNQERYDSKKMVLVRVKN